MESLRAKKISETLRKKHAAKYGLGWLPASRGTAVENKFVTAWDDMKRRCGKKGSQYLKGYGNRGIKISERWKTFAYFFIDMWDSYLLHISMFKNDTSLDRIDNNKGYSKLNCRWATKKEQQNNRTNTIVIRGKTLVDWAKKLGIDRRTLYARLFTYKYPINQALSSKLFKSGRKITIITS
jgi:hypothetical protein